MPKREGGALEQAVARDPATFVYLAGQNAVTPHVWSSRVDRLERPDRLIFDLDPGENTASPTSARRRARSATCCASSGSSRSR